MKQQAGRKSALFMIPAHCRMILPIPQISNLQELLSAFAVRILYTAGIRAIFIISSTMSKIKSFQIEKSEPFSKRKEVRILFYFSMKCGVFS
jgi:hypothetical protein